MSSIAPATSTPAAAPKNPTDLMSMVKSAGASRMTSLLLAEGVVATLKSSGGALQTGTPVGDLSWLAAGPALMYQLSRSGKPELLSTYLGVPSGQTVNKTA